MFSCRETDTKWSKINSIFKTRCFSVYTDWNVPIFCSRKRNRWKVSTEYVNFVLLFLLLFFFFFFICWLLSTASYISWSGIEIMLYASKQFWFDPAIFFSIAVGLDNGSRSMNKSIQADVFLSFIFDLLWLFPLFASDDNDDDDSNDVVALDIGTHDDVAAAADVLDPWIFFRKSNVNRFDDDD